MKKSIRRKVFETNSSSTHSISIYKANLSEEQDIPLDSSFEVEGEVSSRTEIRDEVGKINYIVCMMVSILQNRYHQYDEDEIDFYDPYKNRDENFELLINSNMFRWLKEVVKEQCNTELVYKSYSSYFPYFDTVYDDYRSIEYILNCDVDNEDSFKTRVREIIFNPEYIIEDREEEC